MIQNKSDLKMYLFHDKQRYTLRIPWRIGVYIGNEPCHAFRMVRALRLYEYALNNSSSLLGKARLLFRSLRFRQLSFKYKVFIKPNAVGYGLRLTHIGGVFI